MILLVPPLVEARTTVIRAHLAAKECHAVYRCSTACSHNSSINGTDTSHGVLLPVVSDVEFDNRVLTVRGCAFNNHDYLACQGFWTPILLEILPA